jgi:hypothetical protein
VGQVSASACWPWGVAPLIGAGPVDLHFVVVEDSEVAWASAAEGAAAAAAAGAAPVTQAPPVTYFHKRGEAPRSVCLFA